MLWFVLLMHAYPISCNFLLDLNEMQVALCGYPLISDHDLLVCITIKFELSSVEYLKLSLLYE